MKVDKSKKDKIKQGNLKDFDLLYDVLVNGGTYSDYRSELLDRSMPQEQLNFDISLDDILAAWILGKDEESELYAKGGHIHQGLNSNLYRQQFGGTWNNPHFNSTITPGVDTDLQGSANNFSNNLGAYTLIISGVADVIGNSVGAAKDIDYGKYDAYLNLIGSYNPGFSTDTSFMMNEWNLMPLFTNVSYEDAGGHSGNESAINIGKSMLSGASAGAALGSVVPVIGTAIGAIGGALFGGISQGIGEWRNSVNAKQNQDYINTIGNINAKLNPIKFGYASTLANKLGILNQLSQPYMAACGGKMKNKLASGGYINSHYDYITDPLVKVEAGGTHQENPNEGVLTSIAPDGQPNLVEEDETIINNGHGDAYVFSDRIVADDLILKSHLLPNKFAGKTYADISKELDKIIAEHKNDEISKRTFDEMISRLQQAQEDLKFQEKQEEVEKFLDGLTDEQKEQLEQTMVEEAQAEQQASEEQAIAEQQAQEQAAQEQQMQPEQAPEQVAMEQPEEQIVPSRYDQMMSRALFADAADLGVFAKGGHLHLDVYSDLPFARRNYLENVGMRRDALTGNLFFDPLVRQPIVSDDPRVAEIAKETNDNYIQAGLIGLDIASAINAANLAAKSSSAASALNKASNASKTFSKEADKAIRGFIRGKSNVSPQTLINSSVNQANKASGLRNAAGNVYDLYTSANQARNIVGSVNSVAQPLVTTYGVLRNINDDQVPVNHASGESVYDYSEFIPTYTIGDYQSYGSSSIPSGLNEYQQLYGDSRAISSELPGPERQLRVGSSNTTGQSSNNNNIATNRNNKPQRMFNPGVITLPETTFNGLPVDYGYKNPNDRITMADILGSEEKGIPEPTKKEIKEAGWKKRKDGTWYKKESDGYITDYSTWLRYAPAIGSGIQYLSDLFGVTNRNDFSNADMYQKSINNIPSVGFTPLGNYMTYSPLDETYQQNVARSQYNAARRAIQNNASGNASAALAAMDSLNGNMNNTFGDLALQAREYNDKQREVVEQFNANIARINSMMSLSAQEKNQAIAAEKAKLTYNLAQMRQGIEGANDMAKSANFNNLMTNLGNIGRENYIMNQVNNNLAYYYRDNGDGTYSYKYGLTNAEREAAEKYAKENGLTIK